MQETNEGVYEFNSDMQSCCPLPPEEVCPGAPELDSYNRSQGTKTGYCGDDYEFTMKDECDNSDHLSVKVMFERNSDVECCQTCSCYGDPSCNSFDGTFGEFVLCDGREIPRDSNGNPLPGDRCVIRKSTCEAQIDHEGHKCLWKNPHHSTPNYPDAMKQSNAEVNFPIARFGSPCQYDSSKSSPSRLMLYEVDDLKITAEQYDRGMIRALYINTANGQYALTVEDCLAGKGWTKISFGGDEDYFFSREYNGEYVWNFVDTTTHVEVNLVCTGVEYEDEITRVKFINIENINEPDQDRASKGQGFCSTNKFPERDDASYQNSDYIHENNLCTTYNENITHVMLRESVRAFTGNPTFSTLSTQRGVYEFCTRLWRPQYSSASQCLSKFMSADSVQDVIAAFCKAVSMTSGDENFCNAELADQNKQTGYVEMFKYAREKYIETGEDICRVSLSDLPNQLVGGNQDYLSRGCKNGVELQYYDDESEAWVTYKAFPGDYSPCNGFQLDVQYREARELFKYPIRIIQEYSPKDCTACNAIAAVETTFEFSSN